MASTKITYIDKVLAATILKLIPDFVSPNHVTIFRMLTVPIVGWLLWNGMYIYGFPFFTISIFTDAIDGAMARTQNKITDFGKIADPMADKLLIGVTGVIVITRFLSWQLFVVIIAIEVFLVSVGMFKKFVQGHDVHAEWSGKTKLILMNLKTI